MQKLRIEAIRFGTPVLARDGNACSVHHMRLDAMDLEPARLEPAGQPEPVAASLISHDHTRDLATRLDRLAAPAIEQRQQRMLVGRELLQGLPLHARHETCNKPAQ